MVGTSGTTGAAQQQRIEQNVSKHLDQMFTPLLFSAHCNAVHMPYIEGEVSKVAKTDGVKGMRDGTFGQLIGLMQMAGDETLGADRRQRIVALIGADASKFAVPLSENQRRQVISTAIGLQKTLPANAQPQLDQLKKAMEATECGKMCSTT